MEVLAVVAALVVAGVVAGTTAIRRRYRRSNEVVPEVATKAPASWAGAHSPEARLHRRLRDAVAAVRDVEPGLLAARHALEQQALATDDRLVAVAALPPRVRGEHLAAVEAAVEAVEAAAARLATSAAELAPPAPALDDLLAQVDERVAALREARAELEGGASGEKSGP